MRSISIISAISTLLLCGSLSLADAPATQPVSPSGDVYILPFIAVSGTHRLDWAGKAVQQNLLTDLARTRLHPVAADKPVAAPDAQAAAKAVGAKYLLAGTYQITDQLLRFNGQIVDVATGNIVGGMTATGSERDLFSMEDSLSGQAIRQLSQLASSNATIAGNKAAPMMPPPLPQPQIPPQIVVQVVQAPAATGSSYQGSTLQNYVDANRTPSEDYNQQVQDSQNRGTYGYPASYGYGFDSDYGFGGYFGGYGLDLGYTSGGYGGYGGYGNRGFRSTGGASGYFHHGGGSIGGGFSGGHGRR